jgi:hypothetical protein
MADRPHLFCRHCNFPLTELGEPPPDSIVACPRCGAEERFAALAKAEAEVSRGSMVGQIRDILHRRK